MKNQTDLIDRMASLMDKIEQGTIDIDKAGAVIKAADVVVQVMKTEAAIFSSSGGAMRPTFLAMDYQPRKPSLPAPVADEEAEQERERQLIAQRKATLQDRHNRV
ncbi:hypothetical protein HG264_04130 [Pseudomonas sp. gcc21]|uniref:hypothetical protein n=1 Tax=Pseudomonas sp. gcc21 TaxID=2726989 RepID=UPI001451FC47|nr:hypothetical protein [Pseudomonas sp. gcc21]QJD58159.1 hypothetical protein HG264_04130 [Pseudomonas sp. gcc21]